MIAQLSVIYDCYKSPSYLMLAFITNMITFSFFYLFFFFFFFLYFYFFFFFKKKKKKKKKEVFRLLVTPKSAKCRAHLP